MPNSLSITKLLTEKKSLSPEQAEKINVLYASTGKPEEQLLEESGFVNKEQIVKAKGELFNIPFATLRDIGTAPEVLQLIPRAVAERYRLIPFAISGDGKELSVAFANPLDLEAIEFIELKSGKKIKPYIALEEEVVTAIGERYSQNLSTEVSAALEETSDSKEAQAGQRKGRQKQKISLVKKASMRILVQNT